MDLNDISKYNKRSPKNKKRIRKHSYRNIKKTHHKRLAKGPDGTPGFKFKRTLNSLTNVSKNFTDTGLKKDEMQPLDENDPVYLDLEKHMYRTILSDEYNSPDEIIEKILDVYLNTFDMMDSCFRWNDDGPCRYKDIIINTNGSLTLHIADAHIYDIGITLLMDTLSYIHNICMMMYSRVHVDKKYQQNGIGPDIDPYEISWAIQVYIFRLHTIGYKCIFVNHVNELYVVKHVLVSMIKYAIMSTNLTRENAIKVFKVIARTIYKA